MSRLKLSDEQLNWLKDNDPGAEAPLDAGRLQMMRRRMLAAAMASPAPPLFRWGWIAVAGILLLVGILLWPGTPDLGTIARVPSPDANRRSGSIDRDNAGPQLPLQPAIDPVADPIPEPDPGAELEAVAQDARVASTSLQTVKESAPPATPRDERTVELHLVAPGGTRIVWSLHAGFDPNPALRGKERS